MAGSRQLECAYSICAFAPICCFGSSGVNHAICQLCIVRWKSSIIHIQLIMLLEN